MTDEVAGSLVELMPQVSDDLLRALYAQAPVGIYLMSAEGKCLWTNPRLRAIAGYSLDESLGDGWQRFIHPDDRHRLVSACTQAWAGHKPLDDEYRYVHKDGVVRWARAMSTTLADENGAIIGHAGVVEDVTEKNRLARSVRESEERLRLALEAAAIGIFDWRLDSEVIDWTDSLNQLFDLGRDQSPPSLRRLHESIHPDDRSRFTEFVNAMKAGCANFESEFRVACPNTPVRWIAVHGRCVGEPGRSQRVLGAIRDITRLKNAERSADAARAELQLQQAREKEQIESDLETARSELLRNARLSALGQLAGSVAHELRNPLGAIRNAVFLLERSLERGVPLDDPKWARYLSMIGHEVLASDQIISNMLEMTRPKEPARQNVAIGEIVQELFSRSPNERSVVFQFSARPDPCYIDADPVQIRQVFDNLLKNALDAIPYQQSGRIEIDAEQSAEATRIVVHDSGTGIKESLRGNLFEPLITSKPKGTGLGLWVSRQIIERHGGTIDLADCDQGASFVIVLPRRRRLGPEPRAPAPPEPREVK